MFESTLSNIRNFFTLPRNREERTQSFVVAFKCIVFSVVIALFSALAAVGFLSFIVSIALLGIAFGVYHKSKDNFPIAIIMATLAIILLFSLIPSFFTFGRVVFRIVSWIFIILGGAKLVTTLYSIFAGESK